MNNYIKIDSNIMNKVYEKIFSKIYLRNIDIFLCGDSSWKGKQSIRDKIKPILQKEENVTVLYPEDLFMELLNKKKNNLLTLEKFLANNSEFICIVCESPGSFVELGAFVNNSDTFSKVIVLIQTKYKNAKSFIMMGPVRYIQSNQKNRVLFYSSDLTPTIEKIKKFLINKF